MTELPARWCQAPLEEIIAFSIGGLWGSAPDTTSSDSTTVAVIRGADYRDWAIKRAANAAVRSVPTKAAKTRLLEQGDLVIEVSGGGPTQPVGRVVIIDDAALNSNQLPLILSNFCRRIVVNHEILPSFIYYQLLHKYVRGETERFQTATTNIRNLNFGKYTAETIIRLAPRREQERIIAAVEEQFSRLDAGDAALERVRRNQKRLRDLLPLLLLAGIGPDIEHAGVEDEPVDDSIHRWVTLAEVSERVVDCDHSTPKFLSEGMPCVDTTCISPGVIHRDKLRYVDPLTYKSRVHRLVPQRGDLIFAREGTVGTAVVVPKDLHPCLGQRVMLFRPDLEKVDSEYLCLVINSQIVKRQYRPMLLGTTVPHLNVRDAKALRIPLPALSVQRVVVAEADRIGSVLNAVESAVELNAIRSSSLRSSVLAAAFSGKLASQDPDDEAASALLERITAEHASSNGDKSTLVHKRSAYQRKVTS